MAAFPGSVVSFSTKRDLVDIVYAAHVNTLQAEVVAIEKTLGTDVQGTKSTVALRLTDLENRVTSTKPSIDLNGGSVITQRNPAIGLGIQNAGQTYPLLRFLNKDSVQIASVDADGAGRFNRFYATPGTTADALRMDLPKGFTGRSVAAFTGTNATPTWQIDRLGNYAGAFARIGANGLFVTNANGVKIVTATVVGKKGQVSNLQEWRVQTTTSTAPTSASALVASLSANGSLAVKGNLTAANAAFDSAGQITFGKNATISAATGSLALKADTIKIGNTESTTIIYGDVSMPQMKSKFWTFAYAGDYPDWDAKQDALWMEMATSEADGDKWKLLEDYYGDNVRIGTTFEAPRSGVVAIFYGARMQTRSRTSALSYSIYKGSSLSTNEFKLAPGKDGLVLEPNNRWSAYLNCVPGPLAQIAEASVMSVNRVRLTPGETYTLKCYYRNENYAPSPMHNSHGRASLLVHQITAMIMPEL